MMQKRTLGNRGLAVSALALVCVGYGNALDRPDRRTVAPPFNGAVERGIHGDVYGRPEHITAAAS